MVSFEWDVPIEQESSEVNRKIQEGLPHHEKVFLTYVVFQAWSYELGFASIKKHLNRTCRLEHKKYIMSKCDGSSIQYDDFTVSF